MTGMRYVLALPLALTLGAAPLPAQTAQTAPGGAQAGGVTVPESIVTRNVPPIPRGDEAKLLPYENIRTAQLADWHPRERRILIRTRFAQTVQVHEVGMPMGARTQLTFFKERTTDGVYRPSDPRQIAFSSDLGGAENYQIYLLDRESGIPRMLTDGEHRNLSPLWSHGGKLLAFMGNARNGRDMDLYVIDPDAAAREGKPGQAARRVAELSGSWDVLDWSPDDRRILLSEYISANESYLHWVDLGGGAVHPITPKGGPEKVSYEGGRWARNGRAVYTTTDRGSEFHRLVRIDLDAAGKPAGEPRVLTGDIPWDVEDLDLSDDGAVLAFVINEDGMSRLHLRDVTGGGTGRELRVPEIPAGTINGLRFRPGSHEVGFAVSWARSPADVYSFDPAKGKLERWTASEAGGLPVETFVVPQLVRFPTFDEERPGARRTIPAWVYRPPSGRFPGKRPVYIDIHGGPEGQERPSFLGSENYVLNEMGVVLIYPNVRGSTGYGKTYLALDNAERREDSVKDIGALLDWISTQPDLDASRVMVGGGSYGGYMVLASLLHYSDRLRCGYDVVGISNFTTFLQNTQEYRRDLRRAEYGDERDPAMRAVFERISPALHADRIRRPLLVAQGANDPRVPLAESDQIVQAVSKNNVPVWYVVAKNEGHGFSKKENTDYLRLVLFDFMRRYLIGNEGPAAPAQRTAGR